MSMLDETLKIIRLWHFCITFLILNFFLGYTNYPMLTVISPAKTLDFDATPTTKKSSLPSFTKQAKELISILRTKSGKELSSLMGISPRLAELNVERYQNFKVHSKNGKQAIFAFKGDVYIGLDASRYTERDFTFAQNNLRILSGLYGVLKPLDLIQPYRLDMGTKLSNSKGDNLYDFWQDRIGKALINELAKHSNKSLINLASNEYFKAIHASTPSAQIITPVFKDFSNGNYRVLSFFAKKARGAMASFLVRNRINKPDDLKAFDEDGYRFNEGFSTEERWVYTRKGE